MSSSSIADPHIEERTDVSRPAARIPTVMVANSLPSSGRGPSHTCASIARNLSKHNVSIDLFTPYGNELSAQDYRVNYTWPPALRFLPFSKIKRFAKRRNEALFLSEAKRRAAETPDVITYVWPTLRESILPVVRELRAAGLPIVREMINCHVGTAKELLDAECERLGVEPTHPISAEAVSMETEALQLADYVFCPSALVEKSVADHGIARSKIVATSFGWDPDRFCDDERALNPIEGPTFLFVGSICVRKGAHLLLRYWAKSGIRGRLVMVGEMEPAIERICAEYLRRDDVEIVRYTSSVRRYYRSADVFAFPSLEEGGVLVTHEAGACGLPLIVSPMGAARMADDFDRLRARSA